MIKTILCAVDINRPEEEKHVLQAAARLAQLDDAQLDVVTVVPDFGANVVGAYFQEHQVETAKDKASEILKEFVTEELANSYKGNVRHIVAIGSAYEEVLRAAKLNKADVIVIGASRPDLKDYLLGPNAARVVRHSDVSVYVVR